MSDRQARYSFGILRQFLTKSAGVNFWFFFENFLHRALIKFFEKSFWVNFKLGLQSFLTSLILYLRKQILHIELAGKIKTYFVKKLLSSSEAFFHNQVKKDLHDDYRKDLSLTDRYALKNSPYRILLSNQ